MTATLELRHQPVQQRSQKRLAEILDAGRQVLAEVGRDRLTTAMVAERAGMAIGTFYRYFEDRLPLLEAIQPDVYYPRTITTLAEIQALPVNAILMCSISEVFHLHADANHGYPVWLAAGYNNAWSDDQVLEWAPLTYINAPAGANTL